MTLDPKHKPTQRVVYWVSVALLLTSVGLAAYARSLQTQPDIEHWKQIGRWIVTFWTVYPPVWMSFEWWRFSSLYSGDQLTRFREAQAQTRTMWLAIILVLSVLFGIDLLKA